MEFDGTYYDVSDILGQCCPEDEDASAEALTWCAKVLAAGGTVIPGVAAAVGYFRVLGCVYSQRQLGDEAFKQQHELFHARKNVAYKYTPPV